MNINQNIVIYSLRFLYKYFEIYLFVYILQDHLYHDMQRKVNYFQNIFGTPDVFNKVLFGGKE